MDLTQQAGILILGDVMVDRYWFGQPTALAEESPVAVLSIHNAQDRAGGAANVALNIKNLGGQAAILAPIGQDKDGESLKAILSSNGIAQHWIYANNKTITKQRILSAHQQLVRVDFEQKYHPIELNDETKEIIAQYKVIVCSDYNKGSLVNCAQIISYAKSLGKIVIADPKGLDFAKYQDAHMLTPNYKEFTDVVGSVKDQLDFDTKAYNLINKLDLDYLLVTCGKDGMVLFGRDKFKYSASSYANQVYDVTGAGDTVIASLAVSLANNEEYAHAIERASHAAAVVVSKVGTDVVTLDEINDQLAQLADNNELKVENKIIRITAETSSTEYNNLIQSIEHHAEKVIYHWVSDVGLFDSANIKAIIALKEAEQKKIFVILKFNYKSATDTAHTPEQLAYMISKIKIIDKVIYRDYA